MTSTIALVLLSMIYNMSVKAPTLADEVSMEHQISQSSQHTNPLEDRFTITPIQYAETKATKEGKSILIMASAQKCRPCKVMKDTTLKDSDVIESIQERFIFVYIDYKPHGVITFKNTKIYLDTFLATYNLGAFPSYAFISPDGKHLNADNPIHGAVPTDDFLSLLNLYQNAPPKELI